MVSYTQMRRVTNTTNLFCVNRVLHRSILRHLLHLCLDEDLTSQWSKWLRPLILFFFLQKKTSILIHTKEVNKCTFFQKKINLRIPKNIYIWIVFHLLFIFQGHLAGNSESFIFIIFIWICDRRVSNYETTKNISKHLVPRFFVFQFMYIL